MPIGSIAQKLPLAKPPEGVEYFTQPRLEHAIDASAALDASKFQVATFVCNLWHSAPAIEKWFGKGFSEWDVARRAQPQFDGHYQPKRPLWGYYDELDPLMVAHEIELASSSGIDVFMVDWYWHDGTRLWHEWLEDGFLKSPNREKIKFAVMWANHDWTNFYPSPASGQEAVLIPQTYSDADIDRMTNYLIEHYLRQPNYWRIDGKPVFGIWGADFILRHFGVEKLRATFDRMREHVAKAIPDTRGLHIQACDIYTPGVTPLEQAGFDSATRYHTYAFGGKTNRTSFVEAAEFTIKVWKDQSTHLKIPYFPDCPVGWDNTPRFGARGHVFEYRTADQYERLLEAAKRFIASQKTSPPIVYLSAWNEWTEDHYLLPDEVYGYTYLEAVKRQFG
jgi:hypothetical protein